MLLLTPVLSISSHSPIPPKAAPLQQRKNLTFDDINLPTPRPVGAKQPHCRPGPTLAPGSMRQINHNQAPRPPTLLASNPYTIPSNSSIRVKDIHVIDADVDASVWGMSSQAPLGGEGRGDVSGVC